MKTLLFLFGLILFTWNTSAATGPEQLFSEGNTLYRAGEYEAALEKYQQITASGYSSPRLFYNTGNSWYRLKEYPLAILNYEKALKLDPSFEDAAFNLSLANRHITDKVEGIPELAIVKAFTGLVRSRSADNWAWSSVQALVLAFAAFGIYRLAKNPSLRKSGIYLGITATFIFVVFTLFTWMQKHHLTGENYAIITEPVVNVMSAPGATGSRLFVIHEGLKIQLSGESGDWREIRLANGDKGWVKEETLSII